MRTSAHVAQAILQPILDEVDRHPREVQKIVHGLTVVEDREPNTPQFWFLWKLFVERVRRAGWLTQLDDQYQTGYDMIANIFLSTGWKEDIRHWKSLEGNSHHVHSLFESLPPYSIVLDCYVGFLSCIGEQSLPESFIRIEKSLQSGVPQVMLRNRNTVFLLEVLLQRYVYGKPLELKSNPKIRDAVILILDQLIEEGSSAAFQMRDDFVTPVSDM